MTSSSSSTETIALKPLPSENQIAEWFNEASISPNDLLNFVEKKEYYGAIWKKQGVGYWIKFLTSFRERIYQLKEYHHEEDEFDPLFIDLVKKLTSKKFGAIVEHLNCFFKMFQFNTDPEMFMASKEKKEKTLSLYTSKLIALVGLETPPDMSKYEPCVPQIMERYDIFLKFYRAFVRLFQDPEVLLDGHTTLIWQPPKSWLKDAQINPYESFMKSHYNVPYTKSYEMYLRSCWGAKILEMLDLKKESLNWWAQPICNKVKVSKYSRFRDAPKEILLCTLYSINASAYSTEENSSPKHPETLLPKTNPRPLVTGKQCSTNHLKFIFFKRLKHFGCLIYKWELLEFSFGPFLAPHFHKGSATTLLQADPNNHFLKVNPWFICWMEAFGLRLIHGIAEQHDEIQALQDSLKQKESTAVIETVLQFNCHCFSEKLEGVSPITSVDFAKSTKAFLLEPTIIMQLAFQPTILQQWISVALLEIMSFELMSLELRHWPLLPEVELAARRLLSLVARGKESVLLAFCLLMRQCSIFPECDPTIPAILMDKAIIPATAVLEYLCTRKAYNLLNCIKIAAFSNPNADFSKACSMPSSAYEVNPKLVEVYSSSFWHLFNWIPDSKSGLWTSKNPIPQQVKSETSFNFQEISQEIKYEEPEANEHFSINNLSAEEKEFYKHEHKHTSYISHIQNLLNNLIEKKHFSVGGLKKINNFLRAYKPKFLSTSHTDSEIDFDRLSSIEKFYLINNNYCHITLLMNGICKRESTLAWLVRRSGEILEQEQLVRLVAICSTVCNEIPILQGLSPPKQPSNITMAQHLKTLDSMVMLWQSRSREWLWSNLPQKWQTPLLTHEPIPDIKDGLQTVVNHLDNRVGRLLFSLAKAGLEWKHDLGNTFSQWKEVQYLLPCYISCLATFPQDKNNKYCEIKTQNLITLLHHFIHHYEREFSLHKFFESKYKGIDYFDDIFDEITSNLIVCQNYTYNQINELLFAFCDFDNTVSNHEGIPGFHDIKESLLKWPIIDPDGDKRQLFKIPEFTYIAFKNVTMKHGNFLLVLCITTWNPPKPGSHLPQPFTQLGICYFNSHVAAMMEIAISLHIAQKSSFIEKNDLKTFHSLLKIFRRSRYLLVSKVTMTQNPALKELTQRDKKMRCLENEEDAALARFLEIMVHIRESLSPFTKVYKINIPHTQLPFVMKAFKDFANGDISLFTKCMTIQLSFACGGQHETDDKSKSTKGPSNVRICSIDKSALVNSTIGISISPTSLVFNEQCLSSPHKRNKKSSKPQREQKPPASKFDPNKNPRKVPQARQKKKKSKKSEEIVIKLLQSCNGCKSTEELPGSYSACQKCLDDNLPDVNYFCSPECKKMWWDKEHMAEHLEYDLGLGPLHDES